MLKGVLGALCGVSSALGADVVELTELINMCKEGVCPPPGWCSTALDKCIARTWSPPGSQWYSCETDCERLTLIVENEFINLNIPHETCTWTPNGVEVFIHTTTGSALPPLTDQQAFDHINELMNNPGFSEAKRKAIMAAVEYAKSFRWGMAQRR